MWMVEAILKSNTEIESFLDMISIYSDDIKMDYGVDKSAVYNI